MINQKQKEPDHQYIFLVPNDPEGNEFYRLAQKFIEKRLYRLSRRGNHSDRSELAKKLGIQGTSWRAGKQRPLLDVPVKHAENWRIYIEAKSVKSFLKGNTLSHQLFDTITRLGNAKLIDLMRELQKEFKVESIDESITVKSVMERLLASFIAGLMKGKYDDDSR